MLGRKIGVIFTFRKLREMSAVSQTSRSTFMAPLARFSFAVYCVARQVDKEVIGIAAVLSRELLAQRKVAGLPNVRMCFATF